MQSVVGMYRHITSARLCQESGRPGWTCENKCWEVCDKCGVPICGIHLLKHYRRMHPTMI